MPISLGEWRVRIGRFVRWQQEPSYIKHVFVIQRPSANAETSNAKDGSSGDTNSPKNRSTSGPQPHDSCGKEGCPGDGGGEAGSELGDGESHAMPGPSDSSSSKCDPGQRCSMPTNQSDSVGSSNSDAPRNDDHTAQPEVITTSHDIKGAHRQGCFDSASLPNSSGISGGNSTPSLLPTQSKGINKCGITSDPVLNTLLVQGQRLQKSTHDKGSVASHQENHMIAQITTPDTTELLLLRSGDVESNPGPKGKHSQADPTYETVHDFDNILKKVARGVAENSEIDDLGKALGFEPTDIQRYIQTNHRYQGVTSDGTLQMLRDWLKKQKHGDELPSLRDALQKAGLLRLADTFLPLNKSGSHDEGNFTPLSDNLLDRVCEEIRRYYLLELCFIQPDPLKSDIFVKLGDIFTDLTLLDVEENMGVKHKTPLPYRELYNVKIRGLEAKRLLVVGDAGVGKTTLCAKIAQDWAERRTLVQCKLLVVILLRKAKDKTVGEIIKTYLSDSNPVEAGQLDKYILSNPQDVFMVLDGLDEFDGDFSGLNQVVQIILNKVFKSGTVLITTRQWKLSLIRDIPNLRKVYAFIAVEGFSSENQSVYIKKFFQADTESSEQLISFIAVNDVIRENMASFPIYTAMLCIMWKEYDGERRQAMSKLKTFSQLLKEMIDFLIDHYLQKIDERRPTINDHLTVIGKVAFQGLLKRQLAFPEDTFQSCQESKEIGCEVGVLTRDKHATSRQERRRNPLSESYMVQFPHKLFQEYLSAMFLTSLYHSDPQEYEKLMIDIMQKAREFQYLLYFISALEEKLGHGIVTGLIANKVDDFIIDVTYESQFQSVAEEVAKHLDSTSSTLELDRRMSEHTVSGHLFVMKHQKQLDELKIQRSCGPDASTDLAAFLCSSPSLRSVRIGVSSLDRITMHDFFFSVLADSGQHSKIEKLKIKGINLHSPEASCHLAQFICKMSHLKDLALQGCSLHDDFYHTTASSRLSSQVENLNISYADLIRSPESSCHLAHFIFKMSLLKSLTLCYSELHDSFHKTAAESVGPSTKVENLHISRADLIESPESSCHLAHFICKMSLLKSLTLAWCKLHDSFYKTGAESVGPSTKVEKLTINGADIIKSPEASCHLAHFICKMSPMKSLTLSHCKLHDSFYKTAAESVEPSAQVENLNISHANLIRSPESSCHLAHFICKMSLLKSLNLTYCELHDSFYKTAAESAGPSAKVENLYIDGAALIKSPESSCHLAHFICKMSLLKSLTLARCKLHDSFYKTAAESVGPSVEVENLDISTVDLIRSPEVSCHLARFICKMSLLKSLTLHDCDLHDSFYKTAAESVGPSAQIRNLNIVQYHLLEHPAASRHLAQFICKLSHLKSLKLLNSEFHDDFYQTVTSDESSSQVDDESNESIPSLSALAVDAKTLKRWHPHGKMFDSVKRLTFFVMKAINSDTIQSLNKLRGVANLTIQGCISGHLEWEPTSVVRAILTSFSQLIKMTFRDLDIRNADGILEFLAADQNNHLETVRMMRCDTDEELDGFIHDLNSSFKVEIEHGKPELSIDFEDSDEESED